MSKSPWHGPIIDQNRRIGLVRHYTVMTDSHGHSHVLMRPPFDSNRTIGATTKIKSIYRPNTEAL